MKKFKKDIKYSKKERAAIALLIVLLIAFYSYNLFIEPRLITDSSTICLEDILTHRRDQEISDLKTKTTKLIKQRKTRQKIFYHPPPKYESFDPNKIDSLKWIQFGVKPWTIATIIKYKSKGGKFYKCDDLSKVYNLPDSIFRKLLPFCSIQKERQKQTYTKSKKTDYKSAYNSQRDSTAFIKYKPKPVTQVNLNSTDTAVLKKLYGVGPVLSSRIVKYSQALGGFHSLDQLTEVYGLEQEVIDNNESRLVLKGTVKKFNLNSEADSLVKHPYLNWPMSRIIVNYRKQHGDFKEIQELKNIIAIPDGLYNSLLPYLTVE